MSQKFQRAAKRLLLLLLVFVPAIVGLAAAHFAGIGPEVLISSRQSLQNFVQAHEIASLSGYVLVYVAAAALALPGVAILTLMGGFLFGPLLGGAAAVLGAGTGACLIFLLAKGILRDHFEAQGAGLAARLQAGFAGNAFSYLLFLRLVPLFPFFLVNIVPAFCRVTLRSFAAATFLGMIPATFAFAYIGAGLDGILERAGPEGLNLSSLMQPELLWGFGGLGLLALLPVFMRRGKA